MQCNRPPSDTGAPFASLDQGGFQCAPLFARLSPCSAWCISLTPPMPTKTRRSSRRRSRIPSLDFNGYSAQFDTDLSRRGDTLDPPGTSQFRNDNAHPYFGLKFSKPLK